jgi:hypothetical protein
MSWLEQGPSAINSIHHSHQCMHTPNCKQHSQGRTYDGKAAQRSTTLYLIPCTTGPTHLFGR